MCDKQVSEIGRIRCSLVMEIASSFPFVFITKELGNVKDEEFRVVFQLLLCSLGSLNFLLLQAVLLGLGGILI